MDTQAFSPFSIQTLKETVQGSGIYHLVLQPRSPFPRWKAGQFIMLSFEKKFPFTHCARPFSIASAGEDLELFIQIRGNTTKQLLDFNIHDTCYIWGPLGTSFSPPTQRTLLVAGGIGIAPFVSYIQQYQHTDTTLLFGHRLPLEYYPFASCSKENVSCIAMQDTSQETLQEFLNTIQEAMLQKDTSVLACGPMPLLRFVHKIALQYAIPTEISLENTMYCGIGLCLGCVAKTSKEHQKNTHCGTHVSSCTNGPVFAAHTLLL